MGRAVRGGGLRLHRLTGTIRAMALLLLLLVNGSDNLDLTTGDDLLLADSSSAGTGARAELDRSPWTGDLVSSPWRADLVRG